WAQCKRCRSYGTIKGFGYDDFQPIEPPADTLTDGQWLILAHQRQRVTHQQLGAQYGWDALRDASQPVSCVS
ncbi:hypothetical protein, partial [uncultured Hyphomonas sp.]|uniref:hypothetical protein n=1 Tax=uncultured Hyphomonas sp. TaxID=225298 RepID=UPI0030DBA9E0